MSAECPQCGSNGSWRGQSGQAGSEVQEIKDRYEDGNGHTWTVTR